MSLALVVLVAGCAQVGPEADPRSAATTDEVSAGFELIRDDAEALAAFMRAFPKGGDIHHHLIGTPTPELFMRIGAERRFCLDPELLVAAPGPCAPPSIAFTDLAAHPALRDRLQLAWSLHDRTPGADDVPAHFFGVFPKIWSLSETRGLILAHLKRAAAQENVLYLETQLQTPGATDRLRSAGMAIGEGQDVLLMREGLRRSGELEAAVQASLAELRGYEARVESELGCATSRIPACDVAHRYQMYALRILPNPMVLADMILAFEVASRSPLVVGVNVVGFEGNDNALSNYSTHMRALSALRDEYPGVRLALHAGELTAREAGAAALQTHVPEAVYGAGADRIGHGNAIATSANREALLTYLSERGIPVEISLTSNHWLLGLEGQAHHLPLLYDNNVPFTLNTDDAGIFETDLSREYTVAAQKYKWLTYRDFKTLSRRAIEVSFLPGASYFRDLESGRAVAACADPASARCGDFLDGSARARLQHRLESRFTAFERNAGAREW
ncbi:MAG: hypothetical protein AAF610_08140 [Pseudomonadota bacterium]